MFAGFHIRFCTTDGSSGADGSRGEVVDISIPKKKDVNLGLLWEGERSMPGSCMRMASLEAGGCIAEVQVDTLDSLLLELRDLTFGRRHAVEDFYVWRIPKVTKRITRLAEVMGLKALTLKGLTWSQKTCCIHIHS
eukprot:TRINITY_DN90942_c0_g1_i1.p1 TRINITY_DN90942_c0_g1~~TRINITY_DN90942_c0_g1_i1.p1  ORF type:complete len:136 (+),score=21.12 TRINITY_DN90942_c0_g1_i1:120-527(+)